jgi:hypothetical protein
MPLTYLLVYCPRTASEAEVVGQTFGGRRLLRHRGQCRLKRGSESSVDGYFSQSRCCTLIE